MRYDHPNFTIRREYTAPTVAGAGVVSARFATFQRIKVKALHAVVLIAGTATNNGLTVMHGTKTLAVVVIGTTPVGGHVTALVQESVEEFGVLNCTNGADTQCVCQVIYEYEVKQDTLLSP